MNAPGDPEDAGPGRRPGPGLGRELARLSVAVCLGSWDELRHLRRGLDAARLASAGRAWREALLQSHLFAGVPRVVEAWTVLEEEGGLGTVEPDEGSGPDDAAAGRELFGRVYGRHADAVRARLGGCHPALARWVEGHAYGRVLTRGGLSIETRELLAVASLAALAQPRQLAAHVRGARAVGVLESELARVLDDVEDLLEPAAAELARSALAPPR